MVLRLPNTFGSRALFAAYYLALPDEYHPVKHDMTAFEKAEMDAALALVQRKKITKVFAVVSGGWNTAGNWYPSGVPRAGAKFCIPEGCVCTYNVSAPLTELLTGRIDGTLKTDPIIDTAMLFDTLVVTPLGHFLDGTRGKPVSGDVVHDWIIATSNGEIDVAWDTFFQSRGIINLGHGDVWGHRKTPFLEVTSHTGPEIGATTLALVSSPVDWEVGDDIIICSTVAKPDSFGGFGDVFAQPFETERRTLTSVSGADLGWTVGLTYSHAGLAAYSRTRPDGTAYSVPAGKCYVANLTRNIRFRPDDLDAPIHHRGHLMQMHNSRGWSMRNAEIADLGRTAKHGGRAHMIVHLNGGVSAGTPLDLTQSDYWDAGASAIVFGPTFKMNFQLSASGAGNITITGTKADGSAESETLAYLDGFNVGIDNIKYFRTVTEISCSTNTTGLNPRVFLEARSRQLNENGVRNLFTGTPAYTTVTPFDNIQGRYPFHWHKLGVDGDMLLNPVVLDGCSIHGSPGWGVAQHQTNANVLNCVGYDFQAAGLVGEDGNEPGLWQGNLMCGSIGNSDASIKWAQDQIEKDPARVGSPFWFTGRLLKANQNVAVDGHVGFAYNQRLAGIELKPEWLDQPTCTRGVKTSTSSAPYTVHNNVPPLGHFDDNIAIAVKAGFFVVKDSPEQNHDLRTRLRRFRAWSCRIGAALDYTKNYTLEDWQIDYGNVTMLSGGNTGSYGIELGSNVSDQVFLRPIIKGFDKGIALQHFHTENTGGPDFIYNLRNGRHIISPTFISVTDDYHDFNAEEQLLGPITELDHILTTADLNSDAVTVSVTASSTGVIGTKHDELGTRDYPWGFDQFIYTRTALLTYYGYYTDTASGNKYVMMDEWFSSAITGDMHKIILPVDVTSGVSLIGMTNHGSMDLSNNTTPVLENFTVSMTRNTNETIDIVGRATGNKLRFGGFSQPMKSHLVNNGDGTVTVVPLSDENYTETCYLWVDDVNGNTTRATMTIKVE